MNLVFSGSGMSYPVFVGAYKALYEAGMLVSLEEVAGTSGGSIIAALIATGYGRTPYVLERMILDLLPRESRLLDFAWWPFSKMGLIKGNRVRKKLDEIFEGRTMNDLDYPCTIPVVNIDNGETYLIGTSNEGWHWKLADAVRASISIPFVMQPHQLKKDGPRYVDGGLGNNFPVDLFDTETIGFKIKRKGTRSRVKGMVQLFMRMIDIMLWAVEKKHIEDAVYSQIVELEVTGDSMNFKMTRQEARALIDSGYHQTKRWLETRK